MKARRGKPRAKRDESQKDSVVKSPVKWKTARKAAPKPVKETSKVKSPAKEGPAQRTRKQSNRKRPAETDEPTRVKKTRGRPKKPVMVDTATSP